MDFKPFDPKQTFALVKGSLLDHAGTAASYRESDPPWVQTLLVLTLPVVVIAVVLGLTLTALFGSLSMYTMIDGVGSFLLTLVWAVISVFVIAFVAAFLAGTLGGVNHFDRAFAMASLVAVVGYAGSILGSLPWVGWLISLAVSIYALVLFYRDVPLFLEVPDNKRVLHLVLTIVIVFVVNLVLSMAIGGNMATQRMSEYESDRESGAPVARSGVLGLAGDQVASAMEDRYAPPANGEVSQSQLKRMIGFLEAAREEQQKLAAELETLSEQEDGSIGDMLAGMNKVADLSTTEMKVVKDGGGNWAEHNWVKQQMVLAMNQYATGQDGGHNYDLFKQYEDELTELMFLY